MLNQKKVLASANVDQMEGGNENPHTNTIMATRGSAAAAAVIRDIEAGLGLLGKGRWDGRGELGSRGSKRSTQSFQQQRHIPQSLGCNQKPDAAPLGELSLATSIDESINKRIAEGLRVGLLAIVERVHEMVEERVREVVGDSFEERVTEISKLIDKKIMLH